MGRVQDKVAIVTGGAQGIGETTARFLAREGAKVAIFDLQKDPALKIAAEIESEGGTARVWQCDVRNAAEVRATVKEVAEHYGRIDVLVNNAGITGPAGDPIEVTDEELDNVIDTDVKGSFNCAAAVIPYMRQAQGGSIINISSVSGHRVMAPGLPVYQVAKGAVNMLTRSLAVYYAKEKIRCNQVSPGTIMTPLNVELAMSGFGSIDKFNEAFILPHHPMGVPGTAPDVAYAILYLASDESKWVTGADIAVDGGASSI